MSSVAIICVDEVEKTSKLLQKIFGWKSQHGGDEFEDLVNNKGRSVIWLHVMSDEHARFQGLKNKQRGLGSSIYALVKNVKETHEIVTGEGLKISEEPFFNENAQFNEFTFRLKDGYYFTAFEKGPYFNL